MSNLKAEFLSSCALLLDISDFKLVFKGRFDLCFFNEFSLVKVTQCEPDIIRIRLSFDRCCELKK